MKQMYSREQKLKGYCFLFSHAHMHSRELEQSAASSLFFLKFVEVAQLC